MRDTSVTQAPTPVSGLVRPSVSQLNIANFFALSLVKSRLALGSSGWLIGRSFGCHHAKNGLMHRKMVVDCTGGAFLNKGAIHPWVGGRGRMTQQSLPNAPVIKSIWETLFQTRQNQERGMIGQASLLHSWHWVLAYIVYYYYLLIFMINYYEKAGQGMALGHIRRAFLNILRNCKAGKILVEWNKVRTCTGIFPHLQVTGPRCIV